MRATRLCQELWNQDPLARPQSHAKMLPMLNQEGLGIPWRTGDEVIESPPVNALIERDRFDGFSFKRSDQPSDVRFEVSALSLVSEDPLIAADKSTEFKYRLGERRKRHGSPLFRHGRRHPSQRAISPNGPLCAIIAVLRRVRKKADTINHLSGP